MNLYKEARTIAEEAWQESQGDFDTAQEYIMQSCDSHEVAVYYGKAIDFCATQDTNEGEEFLEDCGGITQPGDSFGNIACRIAYATLLCAAMECLSEIEEQESE